MVTTVSGKNPPGKKPPWGVRGRVRVRLRIGLGLGSGVFFPGGFFPRTGHNCTLKYLECILLVPSLIIATET